MHKVLSFGLWSVSFPSLFPLWLSGQESLACFGLHPHWNAPSSLPCSSFAILNQQPWDWFGSFPPFQNYNKFFVELQTVSDISYCGHVSLLVLHGGGLSGFLSFTLRESFLFPPLRSQCGNPCLRQLVAGLLIALQKRSALKHFWIVNKIHVQLFFFK